MIACVVGALAASVYLVITLEILKLRTIGSASCSGPGAPPRRRRPSTRASRRAGDRQLPRRRPRDGRVRGDRSGAGRDPVAAVTNLLQARLRGPRFSAIVVVRPAPAPARAVALRFVSLGDPLSVSRPPIAWPLLQLLQMTEDPPTRADAATAGRRFDRCDDRRVGGRVTGSARRAALWLRPPPIGLFAEARRRPALVYARSRRVEGELPPPAAASRSGLLLRYADLALLALALPVFLLADWPLLGYAAARRPGSPSTRSSRSPTAPRSRRCGGRPAARARDRRRARPSAASGWSTLTILLVGLLGDREDGLAAAVLTLALVTVHLACLALSEAALRGGAPMSKLSTKAKVCIGVGLYLADHRAAGRDRRQRRQERRLPAPERVQARPLDRASTSAASTSRSTRPCSTCCSPAG